MMLLTIPRQILSFAPFSHLFGAFQAIALGTLYRSLCLLRLRLGFSPSFKFFDSTFIFSCCSDSLVIRGARIETDLTGFVRSVQDFAFSSNPVFYGETIGMTLIFPYLVCTIAN